MNGATIIAAIAITGILLIFIGAVLTVKPRQWRRRRWGANGLSSA